GAGRDPACHRGVEVSPAAGEDLQRHVGVLFLEARESVLLEPSHGLLGESGYVDLQAALSESGAKAEQQQPCKCRGEPSLHLFLRELASRACFDRLSRDSRDVW